MLTEPIVPNISLSTASQANGTDIISSTNVTATIRAEFEDCNLSEPTTVNVSSPSASQSIATSIIPYSTTTRQPCETGNITESETQSFFVKTEDIEDCILSEHSEQQIISTVSPSITSQSIVTSIIPSSTTGEGIDS
jgi:hypothetical protein